jgi:signal transduction histidine kinase/BarA-like signal transduction histidine kinase
VTPSDDERAGTFARLLDTLQEGVFVGVLDPGMPNPGRTLVANPALKRLFGLPLDTPDSAVDPFAPARFSDVAARAGFLDRLTSEGTVSNYLLHMRKADESLLQVDVTATVRATTRGGVMVDALLRDATERKRLDDRSRELYQQLLQNEKLAAVGQMVSGVAHELNNPLATILAWAERLLETPQSDTTKRGVEAILSEATRSARIVSQLLTFVHKRTSTRAMIDLNQVVRDTLAMRAYDQNPDISILTALAGGLPKVFVDPYQMQQVLLNLMTNAEQAMLESHGRGTLVVRTWHDAERNVVVLDVTDDGPGVAPENKARIFDAFFTTKEAGKGTGLGLSLAYSIVQEHGGRLRVDSVVGQGASFVVELPVTAGEPVAPASVTPVPATTSLKGVRVLLVEDEKALAAAMSEALAHAGLLVDVAGDGEDALARMRRNQKQYDVVVCDLKMPKVNGMMLYRAIAALAPPLTRRVIFVTGDVAATDAERFLADTGCRWLVKPFRIGDLLRAVRDTIA